MKRVLHLHSIDAGHEHQEKYCYILLLFISLRKAQAPDGTTQDIAQHEPHLSEQ